MKRHNRLWFKNRIGEKVYCTDHERKNADWTECKGIMIDHETAVDNLMAMQQLGVFFSS